MLYCLLPKQPSRMLSVGAMLTIAYWLSFGGLQSWGQTSTLIRLTDISKTAGIDFLHTDGGTGKRYIVESVVAGFTTLDYDGDGYMDIYFVNGNNLDAGGSGTESSGRKPRHALYRNNGDFTFTDVTDYAGVGFQTYGMGAIAGDYDQDGIADLIVSNFGQPLLLANSGDGTFADVSERALPALPDQVGAGYAMLDIENDGDLDLYLGSYVKFTTQQHVARTIGKHSFHPGPIDFPPSQDHLLRNNSDGTFTDISQASGIASKPSYTMGVIAVDLNDDLKVDIMLANDQRPNTLWINDGHGRFTDQALLSGVALDRNGKANGNMGIEIGDVNRNGRLDILTTTYQNETPVLYLNLGNGLFMDQTNVLNIDTGLHPHVTWGCGLVDFDNDGDLDMYIACGHFMDNIEYIDDRTSVKVRDFLLEQRDGRFVNVSDVCGSGLQIVESGRAAVFEDFDNDGDMDVVVLNANAKPTVLSNESQVAAQGFFVLAVGTMVNRQAVGAKIRVVGPQGIQTQAVVIGRGYQSQYGLRQHFAGGAEAKEIEVLWPNGKRERFKRDPTSLTQLVIEGRGEEVK